MLNFNKVDKDNLEIINKFTITSGRRLCVYSQGVIDMWKDDIKPEFAVYNNTLILSVVYDNERWFCPPIGEDEQGAFEELEHYVLERGLPLQFAQMSETELNTIQQRYSKYILEEENKRNYNDYIYSYQDIVEFKGKKYSGQRNHINKFLSLYKDYVFENISKDNFGKIEEFFKEYIREKGELDEAQIFEINSDRDFINNLDQNIYVGGVLKVDDKIVGLTVGEYLRDTLIIHIEKALINYQGAYPMLFNSFAKFARRDGITLISREDDCGSIGLRTSKTQYQPIELLSNYFVKINKVFDITLKPKIIGNGIVLDEIRESDALDYYYLYMDEDNNKYWGYDYHDDIPSPRKDDFFIMQKNDFDNRDNMCLAIREEGRLIGEVILYNFDYQDRVEIGIRLIREEQHHGYAVQAFGLITDYVKNTLNKKPISKCFKQNERSKKMMEKCGYVKYNEDKDYLYYKFI